MALQRVDRLTQDPEPGKHYLVPCVWGKWRGRGAVLGRVTRWWPVIGRLHEDGEHIDFPWPHYHLDQRFLTVNRNWRANTLIGDLITVETKIAVTPLMSGASTPNADGLAPPRLRRLECRQARVDMRDYRLRARFVPKLEAAFPQAIQGKRGWICPHKKYDMSGQQPDEQGNITCPMHGLKFCARTGAVVPVAQETEEEVA